MFNIAGAMAFNQFSRHRTEKPLPLSFVLRLTVALPEFKFRFQALVVLDSELDHKLAFDDRLLKDPSVLRLPASGAVIIHIFAKEKCPLVNYRPRSLHKEITKLVGRAHHHLGDKWFWPLCVIYFFE